MRPLDVKSYTSTALSRIKVIARSTNNLLYLRTDSELASLGAVMITIIRIGEGKPSQSFLIQIPIGATSEGGIPGCGTVTVKMFTLKYALLRNSKTKEQNG
jgi:hypothetical protein